jgi:coatomer subunit beta'
MDKINSGIFISNIFFYITLSGKLNYCTNGKSFFFLNSDKKRFIIGSIEQHNRIYTFDKHYHVYGHEIPFELIQRLSDISEGKLK